MFRNSCWRNSAAIAVVVIGAAAAIGETSNTVIDLNHGWQFRQVKPVPQDANAGWMPATVPGDVHLDLIANKVIPDPFYRDNESRLQWIEGESWEYKIAFDASPALMARTNIDLVFDGLDAASQVYINGAQVFNADNMFRIWRASVKSHLHAGSNLIRVVFPSPIQASQAIAATDPWQSRTKVESRTYIRKAAYEYGWGDAVGKAVEGDDVCPFGEDWDAVDDELEGAAPLVKLATKLDGAEPRSDAARVGSLVACTNLYGELVERLVPVSRWIPQMWMLNLDWKIKDVLAGVKND